MAFKAMYPMSDINTATLSYRFISTSDATVSSSGVHGSNALLGASGSDVALAYSRFFDSTSTTYIVGFWFYRADEVQTPGVLVRFINNDSFYHFSLYVHSSGQLSGGTGSTYTRKTKRTYRALLANSWSHIEVRVVLSTTVGEVDIRINGELALSETGLNTLAAGETNAIPMGVAFSFPGYGPHRMSDMYIIDASTGSPTTMIEEPTYLYAMKGTVDGFHTAWTPSTGTDRYSLIDDTLPGTWTDYISATGDLSYTIGGYAFPSTVDQVFGVMVSQDLQVTGKLVAPYLLFRASSTDYSVEVSSFSDIKYTDTFMAVHPLTAEAWTQASVEAGEYGVKFS